MMNSIGYVLGWVLLLPFRVIALLLQAMGLFVGGLLLLATVIALFLVVATAVILAIVPLVVLGAGMVVGTGTNMLSRPTKQTNEWGDLE